MEVFVGRQPIFNIDEKIVAYELLYRTKDSKVFPLTNPDEATIEVLANAFITIGIDELTKGRPCFVNFTENLIDSEIFDYLNPHHVVIEVLEDVNISLDLIERLAKLKAKGFNIALDDFVMKEDVVDYDRLFLYVDYIKIDFLASSVMERMVIEHKVKSHYPHIKLLAEKVETHEHYEIAKQSGYVLFQGYFFEQPKLITAVDIPANVLQYFQIISLLRDDEPNINILAENIERDISISYKLLQLINARNRRIKSKVRSIKQAILVLGLTELRRWIYLLAMRETSKHYGSDVFNELMRASLFRAKICEKVAKLNYKDNFSEYFLVGLFSLIDSLLQRPLSDILSQLPFTEEIVQTLSGEQTDMTEILTFSKELNKLNWDALEQLTTVVNLEVVEMIEIYDEVTEWVNETYDF